MQNTNKCKLGVIILTLAMLTTAFAVLPTTGAASAVGGIRPNAEIIINGTATSSYYSGAPLAGVKVTIFNNTLPKAPVTTLADGKFKFTVTAIGNYTLTFEHPQYKSLTRFVVNKTGGDWIANTANLGPVEMIKLSSVSGIVKNRAGAYQGDVAIMAIDTATGLTKGETTTSAVGAFTVFVDSANVNVIFRKVGYFEGQHTYALTPSVDTSAGTVYLDAIVPTPTVLLFGVVKNNVGGAGIPDVHVSVSRDGVNWISNITDAQGYYEILTYSGRFKVKAELKGYYTNESWADVPADARHNLDIKMGATPAETNTLTGKVTELPATPIVGATVKLYDVLGKYINGTKTDASGDYTIKFYTGTFRVSVSMDNYFTNSQWTITSANATRDVELTPVPQNCTLSGRILDAKDNYPIVGATVTIYDKAKIYSNTTTSLAPNGFYTIKAYPANFAILVDAPGYQGRLVSTTTTGTAKTQDVTLAKSGVDTIQKSYKFSADWKNVTYTENRTLSVDNGTLRADADIAHGRGGLGLDVNNWDISTSEVTSWKQFMEAQGLPELYTTTFFAIDNLHYELVTSTYAVVISDAMGSVETSTKAIRVDITATYSLIGTMKTGTEHMVSLNASYDTATVDNVYKVVLPTGYEMISNTTSSSKVKVTGFTTVKADTLNGTGVEKMTMSVKMSANGTAKIRITDGTFYEKNSTYKGYEVIVRKGDTSKFNSTVKFSASETTDPVGSVQLANYTWNFGDASALGYGMNVNHNYSAAGLFTVNLTVTETGGNVSYRNAKVQVDEMTPVAKIDVVHHTIASATITINEDNKTSFTGGNSTDMITGTTAGIIQTWQWSWGDGTDNETMTKGGEANINHTYQRPGTYSLKMNVTDVVDHVSANSALTVVVKDVTKPTVDWQIMNSTYAIVTSCRENITFSFNSTSTDNYDTFGNLTYTWTWGDGSSAETGRNLTHTFAKVSSFNVTLNVTDKAGNWATKMVPVTVSLGVRPDLMLYANTFKIDPKTIDDGQKVTLTVNFTNKGEATATGVVVTFFVRNSDGTNDRISGTAALTNKDGTTNSGTLDSKKNATATLSWKPSGKGNYTIYVTVNCTGEHSTTMFDNNNGATLNTYVKVNASPMITYAIAGVAIGVFIIGAVVYFFWVKGKSAGGNIDDKRKKK